MSNLGDAVATGTRSTITVTDRLPPGLTARSVKLQLLGSIKPEQGTCEAPPALRCTFANEVPPYVTLEMAITVEVAKFAGSSEAAEHDRSRRGRGGDAGSDRTAPGG